MATVGLRELKARLSDYVARVRAGETVIVTRHNQPVAQLVPVGAGNEVVEELRALTVQGIIQWSGGKPVGFPPDEGPASLPGPTVADLVIAERNER